MSVELQLPPESNDCMVARTEAIAAADEQLTPTYDTELESHFDNRQLAVLRVLENNLGSPLSRRDWQLALVGGDDRTTASRRIARLVHKFKESPQVTDRLLIDDRLSGHIHYLLLGPGQDPNEARATLEQATDSSLKSAVSLSHTERQQVRVEQLSVALGAAARPAVVDESELLLTRHFQAHSGQEASTVPAANCADLDDEFFYPLSGNSGLAAKFLCGRCALQDECLISRFNQKVGIAGGLSAKDRLKLRSALYEESVPTAQVVKMVQAIRNKNFAAAQAVYQGNSGFGFPGAELESA